MDISGLMRLFDDFLKGRKNGQFVAGLHLTPILAVLYFQMFPQSKKKV